MRLATAARLAAATAVAVGGLYAARPLIRSWGSTPAERKAPWPGDGFVGEVDRGSTMATTLTAPPVDVWPWLVQMGCDRAGWYSWDRLDNGGRPSAVAINPDWQHLRAGDRMAATPDGSMWFDVVYLDRPKHLVLRSSVDARMRPYDPQDDTRPEEWADSTWSFHLSPTDDGGTRLVVRTTGSTSPRHPFHFLGPLGDLAHCIMQSRQFTGLRDRTSSSD